MIVTAPTIIGNIKKWNESWANITTIVFPPAGGCVIFNAIISITERPTAKPIAKKKIVLSWEILNKITNIIPTNPHRRWPNKTFFGWANSLSGYPKTTTTDYPKDAANHSP